MRGIGLWARRETANRWRSLVVLGVLTGLVGGLAIAAVAGARRTGTAYTRYLHATRASDVMIFPSQLIPPVINPDFSPARKLPDVVDAGEFTLAAIGIREYPQLGGTLAPADDHLFETIDRPLLRSGRQMDPTRDDEVIITQTTADHLHLHLGSRLTLISSTDPSQIQIQNGNPPSGGATVAAHVVGIGDNNMFRVFDPTSSEGYLVSPGFLAHHPDTAHFANLVLRVRPGTNLSKFRSEVGAAMGLPNIPLRNEADDVKRVTHGTNLERTALLLFALAVMLAGIVLVGQAQSRSVYAQAESTPTLRAFGSTRPELLTGLALPSALSAGVAAILGVATAIALSSRFPVGLARQVEPNLGTHADGPVLALGAVAIPVALLAGAAVAAWRATSEGRRAAETSRPSVVVRGLRSLGSLPATIGAGLALDRGRGERSLPVRPAIVGAMVGVVGVVGAFGLVHGIDGAAANPAQAGQVWQVIINPDYPQGPHTALTNAAAAEDNPAVDGVVIMQRIDVQVNGAGIPGYSLTPRRNPFSFVVLHGHSPAGTSDAVLGPSTAKALHRNIGDMITIQGDNRAQFRVVGIGLFQQDPHAAFDQGVWLTPSGLSSVVADQPLASADLITLRRGQAVGPTIKQLSQDLGGADVEPIQVPADVIFLRNVRTLPKALAVFLIMLGLAALAHTLATAVRRRRHDLAVLRAIGMRPAQVAACVGWQAVTVAFVGLAVGIPLGIATGRSAWRLIANATPLHYVAPVAALAAGLAVPAAITLALVVAGVPAWRAARLRPAEVLRTE